MNYTCPVCGYDQLTVPPKDWEICPCCYTQFNYSDFEQTHEQLRARWIAKGAPWRNSYLGPPLHWNPVEQLRNIGYEATAHDLELIAQARSTSQSLPPIRKSA